MSRRQKILGVVLFLLLVGIVSTAGAAPILPEGTKRPTHPLQLDLADPMKRAEMRAYFGGIPQVIDCAAKADYAVVLMEERDSGSTEAEHLAVMEENYERTKSEPEGAVSYHVYVDFQRMVRDLHRRDRLGYVRSDANELWASEFRFCFLPGNRW